MSLLSSIVGSVQTSKAVGALTNATDTAMNVGNSTTTTNQNKILGAGDEANNTLATVLKKQQDQLDPYQALGLKATKGLTDALAPGGSLTDKFSFDPTKIEDNPDYQFQLKSGLAAVKAAAAATGTLGSTGTLKGLTNYAAGLASNEIGQAYNQALATFNTNRSNEIQNFTLPLAVGQNATSESNTNLGAFGRQFGTNLIGTNTTAGNWGQGNANNIEQLLLDKGNAKANGSLQQGKIWSGYLGGTSKGPANAALGVG